MEKFFYVCMGLEGQDDDIDILQGYFRQMQNITVETSMDPDIDLFTFALSAHYFGVVMMKEYTVQRGSQTPDEHLLAVENPDPMPKDLDDAELAELNISPPITIDAFLALPEKEKETLWNEAWEAKKRGSLYDDSDYAGLEESIEKRRGKKTVLRPGDIDFYMSDEDEDDKVGSSDKGKMREQGVFAPWANPRPYGPIPAAINDHLINWPEDTQSDDGGPPSSDDDFYSDNMSESPAPFVDDQFGFPVDPPPVDSKLGREYFEPDREPPLQLLPIPEDPIAKQFIKEAALRRVDELRAQTVHLYEKKKARLARRRALEAKNKANNQNGTSSVGTSASAPIKTVTRKVPIGLVYLTSSQDFMDPLHKGECNIGFYVAPEYRTSGGLSVALNTVIEAAFRNQDCHRLQAILVDNPDILDFLSLYTATGFRQEGIRRRAFFSQIACEWKDITYLAILATEWIHDNCNKPKANLKLLPTNLWDEILSRHQREQEDFIRMEEQKLGIWTGSLKRSSSLETIRETVQTALSLESGSENSGFMTDASSSSSAWSGHKRIKLSSSIRPTPRSSLSSSESGFESEWDMGSMIDVDDGDFFSDSSSRVHDPRPSSTSRPLSASSTWDVL